MWSISIANLVGFRMLPERFSWRRQTLNVNSTVSQTGDSEWSTSSQLSLLPVWECSVPSQPLCNPTPAPASHGALHRPLPKCELKEIFLSTGGFCPIFHHSEEKCNIHCLAASPSPLAFTHAPIPTPPFQYLFHVDAVWAESEWCAWKAGGKPPRLQLFPGVAAESYIARLFLSIPSE